MLAPTYTDGEKASKDDVLSITDKNYSVDVRTAGGTVLPSVTVSRSLDPGDHEPQRASRRRSSASC
jgi:hypothetical protein